MASALAALLLVGVLRVVQPPHSVSPSLSNDHIVDNVGSHEGDGGPLKGVPTSDGTITTPAVGTTKTSATNAVAAQLRHPSARHVAAEVQECPQGDVTFNSAASETISTNLTGFAMSLTNSSSTPCSLAGYPKITWELLANGASSTRPDAAAVQTDESLQDLYGHGFIPSASPTAPIVVKPGHRAIFYLMLNSGSPTLSANEDCTNTIESPTLTFSSWTGSLGFYGGLPTCPGNEFWVSPLGQEGSTLLSAPGG